MSKSQLNTPEIVTARGTNVGKTRRAASKTQAKSQARDRGYQLIVPRALAEGGPYAIWQKDGPGRLLRELAKEHALGDATLTPEELAGLIELFRDEPLPDSLRVAVVTQLRGKRLRRQGAATKRQTSLEQVEYMMLPAAFDEALQEADAERENLKKRGRRQGRYDDTNRLPKASSIACNLVRKRLPTLSRLTDRSLQNEVSKARRVLTDLHRDEANYAVPEPVKMPD
jgi:hypothetical protein